MSGIDIVRTAIGNSLRSRLRTTLTVLAIFIGAFTLTITSAIGTGVSNYIDTQIGAFGAKDVLSITKTAKDAPPANAGPAAYDPDGQPSVTSRLVQWNSGCHGDVFRPLRRARWMPYSRQVR